MQRYEGMSFIPLCLSRFDADRGYDMLYEVKRIYMGG